MKKQTLITLIVLGLVVLLIGSSVLYNSLKDKIEHESLVTDNPTNVDGSKPDDNDAPDTDKDENTDTNSNQNDNETSKKQKAPDFTVQDIDGTIYSLSDFVGKPVILNFWASWCGPCKIEMPDFEQAYKTYKDDINFLFVNLTNGYNGETLDKASSYIKEQGYTFPVYYDTTSSAAYTYNTSSIPVTYFIDAEGYFVAWTQGAVTKSLLQQGIDMLLEN